MNSAGERIYNGIVKENPTFVLMLGMCPTLAVTSSAINGLGMGLTTAVVLALSNLIISLMRKIIPSRVRIPAFIVIIASFVTIVQLLLEAYLPSLNEALGVYIPLIVVNCIILGRAEAYAYSNPPLPSLFDGIGMGLGFSVALTAIGAVREFLGAGKLFGIDLNLPFEPIGIFVLAPGAFFVLAVLTALQNYLKMRGEKKGKDMSKIQSGCNEDCMSCGVEGCSKRFYDTETEIIDEEPIAEIMKDTSAAVQEEAVEQVETVSPKKPGRKKKAVKQEEVVVAEETASKETETEIPETEDTVAETPVTEAKPKRGRPRKVKAEETEMKPEEKADEKTDAEPETAAEEKTEVKTEEKAEEAAQETEEKPKKKRGRKPKTAPEEESADKADTDTLEVLDLDGEEDNA